MRYRFWEFASCCCDPICVLNILQQNCIGVLQFLLNNFFKKKLLLLGESVQAEIQQGAVLCVCSKHFFHTHSQWTSAWPIPRRHRASLQHSKEERGSRWLQCKQSAGVKSLLWEQGIGPDPKSTASIPSWNYAFLQIASVLLPLNGSLACCPCAFQCITVLCMFKGILHIYLWLRT